MQLRYYQHEAVQSLFSYWASRQSWDTGDGNPLIALPTGTGKSVVFAAFAAQAKAWYPSMRMLIMTHVKELVEQDYQKFMAVWPGAPAGIYSAGMGRKETHFDITFGSVQSIVNNVEAFGHIDLVGIDEAHLVSPNDETRYQLVLAKLRAVNPKLKVFGMSATCWRAKQGMLTNDGIFTDICYDRTKPEDFRRFIAEGFLAPLTTKATQTVFDISGVGMSNGDFNQKQLEAAVDRPEITEVILREVFYAAQHRRAWLFFCSGIDHAEHVAATLNKWGVRTACVHSKMSKGEREEQIQGWYSGRYRAMTNNNVLTTGIDYPALDFIAMLRPTRSSSLWVQMLGRGMRVAPGKTDCLVMDFANNIVLGPVDDPSIPGQKRPGNGDAPVKLCPNCMSYNYASARFCVSCNYEFPTTEKLTTTASNAPIMSDALPQIETFPISNVTYSDYLSKKENRTLRVTYHTGLRAFHEYVSIGATGYPGHQAKNWWMQRTAGEPPATIEDAMSRLNELRSPLRVKVWVNKLYPEVLGVEWH